MRETPVLIVGGGPVGLSVGIALGRFGVENLIVERNPGTTTHPKSRGCTARTMETFRLWGIEEQVRAGGMPPGADAIWICESMTGPVIAITHPSPPMVHSPASKCMVAQDVVEEALDQLVPSQPATTLLRSTELVSFEQDDGGVTAIVRDVLTGDEETVRASYLVACDGAGSRIRKDLGIEMEGPEVLGVHANYYYWADTAHLPHVRQGFLFSVQPTDPAVPPARIVPSGPDGERWLWIDPLPDGAELRTEDELIPIVRAHWGIPDLEVRLINTMRWRMSAQVPTAFRRGRVILAGDAAHRFPPAGGMGLNSGVQDAVNLGWKLALVVDGHAPDALLDTYEPERRLIAESNNEWSQVNAARMPRVEKVFRDHDDEVLVREATNDFTHHLNNDGQGFGKAYERGAFIDDGSPRPPHDPNHYWPSDRPGAPFPHMWLDSERTASTIDWFDTAFVLVCAPDADRWRVAGASVAGATEVPLIVRTLPMLAGPFTFGHEGAVLVRPDGIVAWRPGEVEDPAAALRTALAQILAGGTEATTSDALAALGS